MASRSVYGQGAAVYGGGTNAGVRSVSGGMDYVEAEVAVDERRCKMTTKAGAPCRAFAGDGGICLGHQRAI